MEEIAEGVFVETKYEGVNVGAIVTELGVVCVDAPSYPKDARDWAMRIERLQSRPIRYIILTDGNGDRILNTRWLNAPIVTQQQVSNLIFSYDKRYPQIMLDSLYQRENKQGRELTSGPVDRPSLSFSKQMSIISDTNFINIHHTPGPMAGSSWVKSGDNKVIFTGDTVVSGMHPIIAEMYCEDWIRSLTQLGQSFANKELTIVPGRGSLEGTDSIGKIRDYLSRIESTIKSHIENHGSRSELKYTTNMFLDDFPLGNLPLEWVRSQIQAGLERLYDEYTQNGDINSDTRIPSETDAKPWKLGRSKWSEKG